MTSLSCAPKCIIEKPRSVSKLIYHFNYFEQPEQSYIPEVQESFSNEFKNLPKLLTELVVNADLNKSFEKELSFSKLIDEQDLEDMK